MLVPRLQRPDVLADLRDEWRRGAAVRIEPVFREVHSASFLEALRSVDHVPLQRFNHIDGYQAWRFTWVAGTGCDHPLCILGRWLRGDGVEWVSALTESALAAPPDPTLVSDQAAKATFFERYDESGDGRAVAFRFHLTPATWPVEWGGHLERLDGPDGEVADRFSPTWNALDLIDLRTRSSWRRLPLIEKHVEGFTVSGYFHSDT